MDFKNIKIKKAIFFGFVIGVIAATLFWYPKASTYNKTLSYESNTNKALEDQLSVFRKEARVGLTPTPTPIKYISKQEVAVRAAYVLQCYDSHKDTVVPTWIKSIQKGLDSKKNIVYSCINKELNSVVFITSTELPGSDTPGFQAYDNEIDLINLTDGKTELLKTMSGTYLANICNKINKWTTDGNISYTCGGGDGLRSSSQTYLENTDTKDAYIVENCTVSSGREQCTTYCKTSSDCGAGSFCNLENNTCMKICKQNYDCNSGICGPVGPYMACQVYSN